MADFDLNAPAAPSLTLDAAPAAPTAVPASQLSPDELSVKTEIFAANKSA